MEKTKILAHRGLEPSNSDFYPESSFEAFQSHLSRGFGIEFDINFARDGIIILHDSDLGRITDGKDNRKVAEVGVGELKNMQFGKVAKGRFIDFEEILNLIRGGAAEINALHLKGKFQEKQYLDKMLSELNKNKDVLKKIIIFDVKPETAKYLKSKIKELNLAPSVAHSYDIKRYNTKAINFTLISIEDAVKYAKEGLYNWVWFDEWDRIDEGGEKKTYTKENFEILKKAGLKIALVTPELHATSPSLPCGESHGDAKDKETLFKRILEILSLHPDAICTDYPEEAKGFVG